MEDISPNIDPSQFGNQPGTGTDHMMVVFLDKIRSMLDESDGHAAVIGEIPTEPKYDCEIWRLKFLST